ncbi:MAG: hypothetical protein GY920_21730 [Aliivibrio sp.]|nr:hypothetical protein [Aliivibrio sp.]
MKSLLTITLSSILLLGCTSTSMSLKEKNNAYSKYVLNENLTNEDKVEGFKFSGWKSLSDNYLIIKANYKKDYLIETKGRCNNLNDSHGIKLNRSPNFAIYKLGDSISLAGIHPNTDITDKCFIKSIYPITRLQSEHLVNIGKPVQSES